VWEYRIVCQAIHLPPGIEQLEHHAIVQETLRALTAAMRPVDAFVENPPAPFHGPVEPVCTR
jgi:hypothetical protein